MTPFLRTPLTCVAVTAFLLAGCDMASKGGPPVAAAIDNHTSCALDGMLLTGFPGPKAQIHYDGAPEPEFFCDTVEMFSLYLAPEQARRVRAIYVQDMGKASWDAPQGNWIDATKAHYVIGSKKHGAMGPTLGAFALRADAEAFASKHGGKVLAFGEVTRNMVVLDGGVLRDQKM